MMLTLPNPFIWLFLFLLKIRQNEASTSSRRVSMTPFLDGSIVDEISLEVLKMSDDRTLKLSGLAASRRNDGVLWVTTDADDTDSHPTHPSRGLYALNIEGVASTVVELQNAAGDLVKQGVFLDIATGPGPLKGSSYLYVADASVDDNKSSETLLIHRVPEPVLLHEEHAGGFETSPFPSQLSLPGAVAITVLFAERPTRKNTKTLVLLIDPEYGEIVLIVEDEDDRRDVYGSPLGAAFTPGATTVALEQKGVLHGGIAVIGGDVAQDGSEILLKSTQEVFYYRRLRVYLDSLHVLSQVLLNAHAIPFSHAEGTEIAFASNSTGFFTFGEESRQ